MKNIGNALHHSYSIKSKNFNEQQYLKIKKVQQDAEPFLLNQSMKNKYYFLINILVK
jgi:hypothetical protein